MVAGVITDKRWAFNQFKNDGAIKKAARLLNQAAFLLASGGLPTYSNHCSLAINPCTYTPRFAHTLLEA
jgi:hypothetical protein